MGKGKPIRRREVVRTRPDYAQQEVRREVDRNIRDKIPGSKVGSRSVSDVGGAGGRNIAVALGLVGERQIARPLQPAPPTRRSISLRPGENTTPAQSVDALLMDPAVVPLRASEAFPVPPAVVDALRSAEHVLVLAHPPPDADSVGSALGAARALTAAGKTVQICIEYDLPGDLRKLPRVNEVVRASAVRQGYDTVVVVDGADAARLGPAAELLKTANRVVALDHHRGEISSEALKLRPETELTVWRDPHADAAALLVAATAETLLESHSLSPRLRAGIYGPMLSGVFMDTWKFQQPGLDPRSAQVFKHHWEQSLDKNLNAVVKPLEYSLPREAKHALTPGRHDSVVESEIVSGVLLVYAPRESQQQALEIAQTNPRRPDPRAQIGDLKNHMLNALNEVSGRHRAAVLLFETENGTAVSVRSKHGFARELATFLGGGGHDGIAAAQPGASPARVVQNIKDWIHARSGPN